MANKKRFIIVYICIVTFVLAITAVGIAATTSISKQQQELTKQRSNLEDQLFAFYNEYTYDAEHNEKIYKDKIEPLLAKRTEMQEVAKAAGFKDVKIYNKDILISDIDEQISTFYEVQLKEGAPDGRKHGAVVDSIDKKVYLLKRFRNVVIKETDIGTIEKLGEHFSATLHRMSAVELDTVPEQYLAEYNKIDHNMVTSGVASDDNLNIIPEVRAILESKTRQ